MEKDYTNIHKMENISKTLWESFLSRLVGIVDPGMFPSSYFADDSHKV